MSQNSNKRMSLEEFDATGTAAPSPSSSSVMDYASSSYSTNSQSTPTSARSTSQAHHHHHHHPMTVPSKKKPAWYQKAQDEKDSRNMQDCLEDYFGHDAFRLGQGESIETVVEGHDVAIMWDTERNRMTGYPRPTIETTFRRRVVHDALYQDYSAECDYSSDEDEY
ncbi:unnamed protein product [Cylindrotheca closterium]|uniref:Uncharacterized protein n=1 Tax=Cylindrotheca closterium TaxID=2856 RepID=A0AAD2CZC6_9STRA|nr:unnamed protein product [Cylindrotheca closterium]